MSDDYNRLKHKQETPTTFRKFDEIGMFESIKNDAIDSEGKIKVARFLHLLFGGLGYFLLTLFSTIFIIRLALAIPL